MRRIRAVEFAVTHRQIVIVLMAATVVVGDDKLLVVGCPHTDLLTIPHKSVITLKLDDGLNPIGVIFKVPDADNFCPRR